MKQFTFIKIFFLLLIFTSIPKPAEAQVLRELENPPMGVITEDILRCFTFMKPGSFTASYKFITKNVNNPTHRIEGFSIPLVGDLNKDGIPEVVALGVEDGSGSPLKAKVNYIYIYNSKTGKEITRFILPAGQMFEPKRHFHSSPALMALIDVDGQDQAEIILASGNTTSDKYYKQLVCYKVSKDLKSFTEKWVSDVSYDATVNNVNFGEDDAAKPVVQVVDIDGDGKAEILAYNKIYSALSGKLLCTLEDLTGGGSGTTAKSKTNYTDDGLSPKTLVDRKVAYTGRNRLAPGGGSHGDRDLPFAFIYDLDMDGKYEVIAGGKVYYDIDLVTGDFKVIEDPLLIGDGYTGVADINNDGKAEIVVSAHLGTTSSGGVKIVVWDPGFLESDGSGGWRKVADPQTSPKKLLADRRVPTSGTIEGSMSYLYIGDIDGKIQNGKKFPEISILGNKWYNGSPVPVHPNVSSELASKPVPYNSANGDTSHGGLFSFTWDDNATQLSDRLKVSFILEHSDNSLNTGFTLFDFDNNGVQEICYRDETRLRVISPKKPLILLSETNEDYILYKTPRNELRSYTGFEYPVIADIDNNGSANIVVMGSDKSTDGTGYVYALESKPFTPSFAPAVSVWNQFMYSPLKIKENLQTPTKEEYHHPLSPELSFVLGTDKDKGFEVKTFIYNNTITQAVKSALFREPSLHGGDSIDVLRPIVPTPDGQLLHGKIDRTQSELHFYVKNIGNATLSDDTPIRIFLNGNIPGGLWSKTVNLGNGNINVNELTVGEDISVGDSILMKIPLTSAELAYTYTIRLTDPSTSSEDLFTKDDNYIDCNWADNVLEVGDFVLRNDAATVVQYKSVVIDVLENDVLPNGCDLTLDEASIVTPSGVGVMNGKFGKLEIVNNKLHYTAPEKYRREDKPDDGIVKITYSFTCSGLTKKANVYIFIVESCDYGFSGCVGNPYQVCLSQFSPDFSFNWYNYKQEYIGKHAPYISNLTTNVVYYAKPIFNKEEHPEYATVDFPMAPIEITALGSSGINTAKWTGLEDTNWYNPSNWVEVKNGKDYPVSWTPISCVDVVVAKMAPNYPILTQPAICRNIKFEDRAMIAGINYLTYVNAQVDLVLSSTERERFVMWSAPLKDIYTGDYHFLDASSQPKWNNVYMNFFQATNPDYSGTLAAEKTFTATFGSLGTALSLGTAFNIKTVADRTSGFAFPKTQTSYTDAKGGTVTGLSRSSSGRFITDGAIDANSGELNLPVNGNNTYRMIQVVNPFMAYLKVNEFLSANSAVIENSYKLWNGDVNSDFISVLSYEESKEQRYVVDDKKMPNASYALIAPLQSFFVMKKNPSASVTSLNMNASMTTTLNQTEPEYVLKSATSDNEKNTLRITASQNTFQGSTVIRNVYSASAAYLSDEDAYKLFNDFTPITVYTISDDKVPFAINTTGDFSKEVKLGLRVNSTTKPVTLDFSGLESFGKKIRLHDKEKNEWIDLSKNNQYTFKITQPLNGAVLEVNDRFTLQVYGTTTSIEDINDQDVRIGSINNTIYVNSLKAEMNGLKIYTLGGVLLYKNESNAHNYKVDVSSGQVYIVEVLINNDIKVSKIAVK